MSREAYEERDRENEIAGVAVHDGSALQNRAVRAGFFLLTEVRTPDGDIGKVVEYDTGRFNVRVGFEGHSYAWYDSDELTKLV